MAESVDAADLKSAGRKTVGVQVSLPPSPKPEQRLDFGKGLMAGGFGVRHDLGMNKPKKGQTYCHVP